jgi:hypothetical protein
VGSAAATLHGVTGEEIHLAADASGSAVGVMAGRQRLNERKKECKKDYAAG